MQRAVTSPHPALSVLDPSLQAESKQRFPGLTGVHKVHGTLRLLQKEIYTRLKPIIPIPTILQ